MPIYVSILVNAEEIASISISRDGDYTDNHADYTALLLPSRARNLGYEPAPTKEARVLDFDRDRGAVELVYEAMRELHAVEPRT